MKYTAAISLATLALTEAFVVSPPKSARVALLAVEEDEVAPADVVATKEHKIELFGGVEVTVPDFLVKAFNLDESIDVPGPFTVEDIAMDDEDLDVIESVEE